MKPSLILLYPLLLFCHFTQSQVLEKPMGAESNAMAGISAPCYSGFELWNNPALMAKQKETSWSFFHQMPYFQKSLQFSAISVQGVFHSLSAGMGLVQSGNEYFNQQAFSLGIAKMLSKQVYLGTTWHYQLTHQYQLPSFGNFMGSLGLFVQLNEKLSFGTCLFNLNQARYTLESIEKQGTQLRLGVRYQAMEGLVLMAESEKNYLQKEQWKLGLQYHIQEKLTLLAGWSINPPVQSFGIRQKTQNKAWMVGTKFHRDLGFTPFAGFQMNIKRGL